MCLKEALDPSFKVYAENVVKNASALANGLMNRGFDIVSGGTDNHLMLVNLLSKGKTGKEVEKLLDAANITCNKNTIPNDPASPFVTSGIRPEPLQQEASMRLIWMLLQKQLLCLLMM